MENKKVDFSQCEFIEENMWFFTYNDFCTHRRIIKKHYQELDSNGKRFYMWYVYANIHLDEARKNKIWDYLNSDEPEYEMILVHNRKS